MKLYVSGPMSGIPDLNKPLFDEVTCILRERGHEVISPIEMDLGEGIDPELACKGGDPAARANALARDFEAVLSVDAIVCLPGWVKSEGARAEYAVAFFAGKKVYQWDDEAEEMKDITDWYRAVIDVALQLTRFP